MMLDFDRTISPNETMRAKTEEAYFRVSQDGYDAVRRAVFSAGRDPASIKQILDFGCGHGRVLRALCAGFPSASVTACDLLEDGVDFCARTFGARPLQGHEDLSNIKPEVKFDLIWVGSVFTHLPESRWRNFLDFFSSILAANGILVFTVHGRTALWLLENHTLEKSKLTRKQFERAKKLYKNKGYAFVPYESRAIGTMNRFGYALSPGLYGLTYTRPDWICAFLTRYPKLKLISYTEGGWGNNHDTVAVMAPGNPRII